MKTYSIGIIGLGFGQKVHLPAFIADGRCCLKGVAGLHKESAQRVAVRWDTEPFTNWEELLQDKAIDIVSIAVPPAMQPRIIRQAALAGKHVFCEKPFAVSLADAEDCLTVVHKTRIKHAMNFIFPELPRWKKAREIITTLQMGPIRHFSYTWRVETFSSRTAARTWKSDTSLGGGVLNNFGSHVLYNIEWLFGPIRDGYGHLRYSRAGNENCADIIITCESGVSGIVSLAIDAFPGSGHRVEIYCDKGTLILTNDASDYARGFSLHLGLRSGFGFEKIDEDSQGEGGDGRILPASTLASRFLDSVSDDKEMKPNLDDGLRIQRILEMIRRSSVGGN